MSTYGPYGVTCQCFQPGQQSNLIGVPGEISELDLLHNIAKNMIIRTQWAVDQIAPNGPGGEWRFPGLDHVVQKINSYPELICLVGFQAPNQKEAVNPWLRGTCNRRNPPYNKYMLPEDWAIFAENVVKHYQNGANGRIDIIECGNEDYNQLHPTNMHAPVCNVPEVAAATVTAVYQAVRRANPTIRVGAPACVDHNNQCNSSADPLNACQWWQKFFQNPFGGKPPQPVLADYVNYHSYTAGVKCCGGQANPPCFTLLQEAQYIRRMNKRYQPEHIIPIWCTETGFTLGGNTCQKTTVPSYFARPGNITEAVQAQLLMETMEVGRTSGGGGALPPLIEVMCWYTMDYGNPSQSLVLKDKTAEEFVFRQAYYAYKDYVKTHPRWPEAPDIA